MPSFPSMGGDGGGDPMKGMMEPFKGIMNAGPWSSFMGGSDSSKKDKEDHGYRK